MKSKIVSKRLLRYVSFVCILMLACTFFQDRSIAQDCPPWVPSLSEGSTLYLYFPTTSDSSFPYFSSIGAATTPADPFDVSDLDSGIGTTAQLRQRIFEMVSDDFCEFNVEVKSTTSAPNPTETRWQIVAIGSDSETYMTFDLFGEAMAVDIGDNEPQDYSRVWAGSFENAYGGTGEALSGADSTLERWATAIAETTSHEVGHNYGLGHGNSAPRPGSSEDLTNNHILATGIDLTGEQRASSDRHFSDTSYEILGYNLGLHILTLINWDFVNPNNIDAHALQMKILSEASSLTLAWSYNGLRSPWTDPTIASTGSTEIFQGTTYNVFQVDFSTGKSWSGGADGVAPPGVEFHIGTAFTEPDAIIVRETKFLDSNSDELLLSPRLFGFDSGTVNTDTGDFEVRFFNPLDADQSQAGQPQAVPSQGERPLILQDLVWHFVPRMIDLEAMVANATLVGLDGLPISVISSHVINQTFEIVDQLSITIASLTDERNVDITYDNTNCLTIDGMIDIESGELDYCTDGTSLSLFPSTYTYITATIVDPYAVYWDSNQSSFVNGSLEYKIFHQFAGIIPDFNNNGVDDLLDIRHGTSSDGNNNGVPDEVEIEATPQIGGFFIVYIGIAIIIPIGYIVLKIRRKKEKPI